MKYTGMPALCNLDYVMSEAGGAADFVREYTLAAGDPYCDNVFKRMSIEEMQSEK